MDNQATTRTPALKELHQRGIWHVVRTYQHQPDSGVAYGEEAVISLGLPAEQVFKTLMLQGSGKHLYTAVIPVRARLSFKQVAKTVGEKKLRLADPADAQRATGYVVGGISPLGQKQPHPTVIDASALDFETIYVSGGGKGINLELRPQDFMALLKAKTADITADH